MSATEESARDLLIEAAREFRWSVPDEGTLADVEAACMKKLEHIQGAQDRAHAKNGVRTAVAAALEGNHEMARGGLWEANKVLELHAYNWRAGKMEGTPPRI